MYIYEDSNKMGFKEIECESENGLNWLTGSVVSSCERDSKPTSSIKLENFFTI